MNQAIDYGSHESGYPVRLALLSEETARKFLADRINPQESEL